MDAPQQRVAKLALTAAAAYGFVLAGGNAIALHGIGHRPTEDVDLFTNHADPDNFRAGVNAVVSALQSDGWATETRMGWQTYARITATRASDTVSAGSTMATPIRRLLIRRLGVRAHLFATRMARGQRHTRRAAD